MKLKSIKNLEIFAITVASQSAIKGGYNWLTPPALGGGSRPMRPTSMNANIAIFGSP